MSKLSKHCYRAKTKARDLLEKAVQKEIDNYLYGNSATINEENFSQTDDEFYYDLYLEDLDSGMFQDYPDKIWEIGAHYKDKANNFWVFAENQTFVNLRTGQITSYIYDAEKVF